MKFLNIHGYHGSACNSAASELDKPGFTVISPAIDNDAEKLQ